MSCLFAFGERGEFLRKRLAPGVALSMMSEGNRQRFARAYMHAFEIAQALVGDIFEFKDRIVGVEFSVIRESNRITVFPPLSNIGITEAMTEIV